MKILSKYPITHLDFSTDSNKSTKYNYIDLKPGIIISESYSRK